MNENIDDGSLAFLKIKREDGMAGVNTQTQLIY